MPHNEDELQALLPQLPRRLRLCVEFWCRGKDVSPWLNSVSPATYRKDRRLLAKLGLDLEQPHPAPFQYAPPPPPKNRYYTLEILGAVDVPFHTFALSQKDGLYLSPLGRLASSAKGAVLSSRLLAQALADHCLPRLRKRYGEGVEVRIEEHEYSERNVKLSTRIQSDDERAEGYLARNKKFR